MSTDQASEHPGKMGWGDETLALTLSEKHDREKVQADQLAAMVPDRVIRAAARPPVQKMLDKVNHLMRADGIDSGFCSAYIELAVFGHYFDWLAQLIGSCVASGWMRKTTRRILVESFLLGDPEEIFGTDLVGPNNVAPFAPYNYRAGRRLGGLNGNSDGSFCGEHVQGAMQFGMLICSTDGLTGDTDEMPEPQDQSTYKRWGANNTLMDKYVASAKRIQLLESEQITDASEGKDACVDGFKGAMICSSWAFKPSEMHPTWRLANGDRVWIYKRDAGNRWDHNMTIDGFVVVGGLIFVKVDNSWGPRAHKNGSFFYIPIELFVDWLNRGQAECRTIGDIDLTDNAAPFPVDA